jgi:hypothetical protein
MAYSIHPKGYWLWLILSDESNHYLKTIRDQIKIDNGTKNFPLHLTLLPLKIEEVKNHASKLNSYDLTDINNSDWQLDFNFNNYFQSIFLKPIDIMKFNNNMKEIGISMEFNKDVHISLVYSKINIKPKSLPFKSIKICFKKIQIAYVDESNEIWINV